MILFALACTQVSLDTPPAEDLSGLESLRRAHATVEDLMQLPSSADYHSAAVYWSQELPVLDEEAGCGEALCVETSPVLASPLLADGQVLVQLGFSGPTERPPLNLVIAVDSSGSLGPEKMDALQQSLEVLVAQLDEGDLAGLVVFAEQVQVADKPKPMDAGNRSALVESIRGLDSLGATALDEGLAQAYSLAAGNHDKDERVSRVILLTDQPPLTQAELATSVLGQARTHGLAGIGLTVVGLGNELGGDFAWELERAPAGVYLPLNEDEIDFGLQELETLVPWASQLQVTVTPPEGWEVENTALVGLSEASDGFWLGSAYASERRSRLIALAPEVGTVSTLTPGQELGTIQLDYLDAAGAPQSLDHDIVWAGDTAWEYTAAHGDSLGGFAMSLFHDQAIAMEAVAQACAGEVEPAYAQGLVQQAASRLEAAGLTLEGFEDDPVASDLAQELLREADFLYAMDGLISDEAACREEDA